MVFLWPWKRDASSPASFEKTLSTLSAKITDAQARLDRLRTTARRAKVLWTLYLGFAYLVYAIVLLLVVGYKSLGVYEWAGMAGGPVLIYATRAIITAYFTYHIDTTTTRLKGHQDERAKTIQKLKDATKYDSTMELIEKYGGENNKRQRALEKEKDEGDARDEKSAPTAAAAPPPKKDGPPGRTKMPPPPTANIVGRMETRAADAQARSREPKQQQQQQQQLQYMQQPPEPHWYDRLFDVILGEDETAARNRYALICHTCRLVNGQAPPGTTSLADVGLWRCRGCGATNGEEEDEVKRIMDAARASASASAQDGGGGGGSARGSSSEARSAAGSEEAVDEKTGTTRTTATDGPAGAVKARRRPRGRQDA
ncbi:hypothetical protein E4U41_007637 [Claviceps citrina]|nr:hypothetical protein E4U41_007637 [Claviceps citrina]